MYCEGFRIRLDLVSQRQVVNPSSAKASDEEENNAEVFSKKQKSEERYPYEVFETSPPQALLGVFSLSKDVGCGDILRVRANDDDTAYVIKRVASQYKYTDGRFQLTSKRADATELNRAAAEKKLKRLLSVSDTDSS